MIYPPKRVFSLHCFADNQNNKMSVTEFALTNIKRNNGIISARSFLVTKQGTDNSNRYSFECLQCYFDVIITPGEEIDSIKVTASDSPNFEFTGRCINLTPNPDTDWAFEINDTIKPFENINSILPKSTITRLKSYLK